MTSFFEVPEGEMEGRAAEKMLRVREAGIDAAFLRVLASSPRVTDFYYGDFYGGLFFAGTVPLRLKELVRLRLSGVNGCATCQALDIRSAESNGVTQAEIDAIWSSDAEAFGDLERSVLDLADSISLALPAAPVDASLIDRLRQHLTQEQIIELSMVCAVLTGAAKMLLTLGLVEEAVQCDVARGQRDLPSSR